MDMQTFIEHLIEAVDFPEPFDYQADTLYKETEHWDSLAALGVILMFDSNFSITLKPDHFEKLNTVQDLYDFALSNTAA
jgi:acyl carrier protein